MTSGSPFGSRRSLEIEKGLRAMHPKPHLICLNCEWSYGDSNPRPLACHAIGLFISSYGETPFICIIAARSHTVGTNQYRRMPGADIPSTVKRRSDDHGGDMGFSRKRTGRDGKSRYTAYYLDIRGQERSAGTFSNKKDAGDAWKKAEVAVSAGKQGDPSRGRQTFEAYVLEKWLPHHELEPGVRSNYAGQIRKHLLSYFGPMKMRDIMPEHVRQWVTEMKDKGASARTIEYCKGSILNAIFTTALTDEVVTIHPSHGVKSPAAPGKPRRIITAAQFDRLYQALPDADAKLLVETDIESGMRWGELTEVRAGDLDFETCILTVCRAVVELSQDDHPEGGRFLVKDYPKDKEFRRFKLSQQITAKIGAHVAAKGLGEDDLLFTYQAPAQPRSKPRGTVACPHPG
jgi:integrase